MLENNQKEIIMLKDLGMLYPKEASNYKVRFGSYKCYCGNEFITRTQSVKKGDTKSCGCFKIQQTILRNANHITHNLTNHRLYNTWKTMIHRCTNPKRKDYEYYGGRGITVCERWLKVENFIEDMYPTFQDGLTLDRKENDKEYSKDNCRWATKTMQSRNTIVLKKNNKTGYRNVFNYCNKFKSKICVNYKIINLGVFDTAIEAAKAYNKYVIDNNLEHTINNV